MENQRFMVLTGHLNEYPLSDLIGILHHQHKTGRLLIEYPNHPGIFYFKDGNVVEAQFHSLNGLQAVCVALSQPNAAFNFNPLIQPPRQSLDSWSQKVILELFGCWSEEPLPITTTYSEPKTLATYNEPETLALSAPPFTLPVADEGRVRALPGDEQPKLTETPVILLPTNPHPCSTTSDEPKLADAPVVLLPSLPPMPQRPAHQSRQRVLLASGAACLLLVSLSAVASLRDRTGQTADPTAERALPESQAGEATPNVPGWQTVDAPASAPAPPSGARGTPNKFRKFNRESGRRNASAHAGQSETETPATETPVAATTEPAKKTAAVKKPATGGADGEAVQVQMQIENGRVVRASVVNRRPGMAAYEAHALRLARGRRYATKTGQETLSIKVKPSQQ